MRNLRWRHFRENVKGLRLALNWDRETLRDFFEKKRGQQK
jgi:hypothetical protein